MILHNRLKQVWTLFIGISLAAMLGVSSSVMAIDLQSAKNQGLVGETPSGYLAIVKNASGVNELVKSINQARKQKYQSIASRNGTSLQIVEVLAGKKAIQKAAPGHYIQTASGNWIQK